MMRLTASSLDYYFSFSGSERSGHASKVSVAWRKRGKFLPGGLSCTAASSLLALFYLFIYLFIYFNFTHTQYIHWHELSLRTMVAGEANVCMYVHTQPHSNLLYFSIGVSRDVRRINAALLHMCVPIYLCIRKAHTRHMSRCSLFTVHPSAYVDTPATTMGGELSFFFSQQYKLQLCGLVFFFCTCLRVVALIVGVVSWDFSFTFSCSCCSSCPSRSRRAGGRAGGRAGLAGWTGWLGSIRLLCLRRKKRKKKLSLSLIRPQHSNSVMPGLRWGRAGTYRRDVSYAGGGVKTCLSASTHLLHTGVCAST